MTQKPKREKNWGVWSAEQDYQADDPISSHVSAQAAQNAADRLKTANGLYYYAAKI